jgi:CheY-like chemotaxis protein
MHNEPHRIDTGALPHGLRVLVADDNPAHLWDVNELLGRLGITAALAGDGAEAVALAAVGDYDLILLDLQMPVLDGLGAARQIRQFEQAQSQARTPMLAYTSQAIDVRVLRDCGLDGVLDKPCSAVTLRQCLQRWCAAPAHRGGGFDRIATAG